MVVNAGREITRQGRICTVALPCLIASLLLLGPACSVPQLPDPDINDNFLNDNGGAGNSNTSGGNDNIGGNDNTGVNDNSVANDNAGGTDNQNDNTVTSACTGQGDCPLGQECRSGVCAAAEGPDLEIGDEAPFAAIVEGGDMIVRRGFQGGNHIFLSVRAVGFDPQAGVEFTRGVVPVDSPLPVVIESTVTQFFTPQSDGTLLLDRIFTFIDGVLPDDYDGKEATVTVRLTDLTDPSITAELVQQVVLRAEQ